MLLAVLISALLSYRRSLNLFFRGHFIFYFPSFVSHFYGPFTAENRSDVEGKLSVLLSPILSSKAPSVCDDMSLLILIHFIIGYLYQRELGNILIFFFKKKEKTN